MRTLALFVLLGLVAVAQEPKTPPPARVLPGLQRDGFVQLPNGWKLNATGKQIDVGDFPVNIQFHPTGQFAAVLHNGYRDHEVAIIGLADTTRKIVSRVTMPQSFTGLAFSPDGKQLYASGGEFDRVHVWDFDKGLLHNARTISIAEEKGRMVAGGLCLDTTGKDLFVAAVWADAVVRVPLDNPDNKVVIRLTAAETKPEVPLGDPPSPPDNRREVDKDVADDMSKGVVKDNSFPYTCLAERSGRRLFVSLWANAKVAVIDLETNKVVAGWPTAAHPTEMALSPNGRTLFVACANSTKVSVFDTATGETVQTIHCALYPQAPSGNTPNSLCLTPDGEMLFVANADANNLAVFNVADPKAVKPLGFIPTSWYPTSVRFNPKDKTLYVANGKGRVSKANPSGPNPEKPTTTIEYIGSLFSGTVSTIPLPTPADMAKYSKVAYQCSPLNKENEPRAEGVAADNPIPRKAGDKSPIKHCIYVVKENRTYDQVFGDIKAGNGEPSLCLFPEQVTPNLHKLATEFVLLDNTYVEGEVSADGHEWSMGAYATDFVEKMWPLSYRGSPKKTFGYPAEGAMDEMARPAGGYLWDRAKDAGVSYRSYGEWIENGKKKADGTFEDGRATVKALEGHFDPKFRSYDLDVTDQARADRFIEELARFEKEGTFPRLTIIKLPNDHTAGTRVGKPTPSAMVADNDLALGRIVEAVSKSKFWKETAIFVIEDDAQNGPDHVDAHRVEALVISPYTKRKFVDSTMYSTSSLLRTMELILGLKPMSQFDAAARPMYHSFSATPDFTPYTHAQAKVDIKALNKPGAVGAALSQKLNLAKEDQADDLQFNDIIWKSVKGANSRMPAPVRAAFFVPVKPKKDKKDDDDDD
ncbi:alkaline phosphatase family protein [Limnoglobus roseus]|uniref:YVTN family beta-propeller repeat-containing protein n=1 Tax=Limnoglobus roseus TaxID=2598579 RepID=A0A5C1A7L9_9BACT|nr:alkaline phosphatase family protein [Limnoglobus roseus]QEL15181.1 YVTN family beta-propeller repeat-containing protein [Limnoglobus roseus]